MLLAGCGEEDRQAEVSIRPAAEETAETAGATAGRGSGDPVTITLAPDSTTVMAGADTMFSARRIPAMAPGSDTPLTRRLTTVLPSPDGLNVSFVTAGPNPSVGVWSRVRQVASIVAARPGGAIDTIAWSEDGRFLAHAGRDVGGVSRTAVHDARIGAAQRHPVLTWIERGDRGVRFVAWRSDDVLEVEVESARGGEERTHVWDLGIDRFQLAEHVDLLPRLAPSGIFLSQGGVFSLDLHGDGAFETVALYRDGRDGSPGALVLSEGRGGASITATRPLVDLAALGLEKWTDVDEGAGLYGIADLGTGPFLLLTVPSARAPMKTIAIFRPLADDRIEALRIDAPAESGPAFFRDGRTRAGRLELGVVDLDGDGDLEVVQAEAGTDFLTREIVWSVQVYDWRDGRLVRQAALDPAAAEAIGQAAGDGGGE